MGDGVGGRCVDGFGMSFGHVFDQFFRVVCGGAGGRRRGVGDLKAARDFAERSLRMKQELHGDRAHADVAVSLHELGVLCRDDGDIKAARDSAECARSTQQTTY